MKIGSRFSCGDIFKVIVFVLIVSHRSVRAAMSLANRAIFSYPKGTRAEADALVLRILVEDYDAQLKRCNGKEPFDHDPGASLADLIDHQDNIAARPSSMGLAAADFDAGESNWLTDTLDKRGVPYFVESRTRGDHVLFPFAEHSGGNFRWEGNGGHGDVIVDKMIVMKDLASWLGFLVKLDPKTPRANLKRIFRGIGWKPRVEAFEADELEGAFSFVNGPLPNRGKLEYGGRQSRFNAAIWYDAESGLNPSGRIGQMLRARIPGLEDRDKYAREVMRTFKSTITKVKLWMTACLDAARNLATRIPGFTPAYIRVLSAMLAFAKTTGMCWANQENIARAAGCCDRTVRRAQKFFRECGLLIDEGYHKSGTRRFSFGLGKMSDKLSFSPEGSVVSLVRRLLDDVDSVVLPSTMSTPRQPALRMSDRAPP